MSKMKEFAMKVSREMGFKGNINKSVRNEASRRIGYHFKYPKPLCERCREHEVIEDSPFCEGCEEDAVADFEPELACSACRGWMPNYIDLDEMCDKHQKQYLDEQERMFEFSKQWDPRKNQY